MDLPAPGTTFPMQQGADIVGGMERGFQMGEAFRQQREKREVADIMRSADLSSTQGQTAAAQKVSAINPQLGMQMLGQVRANQQFAETQQYHRELIQEKQETQQRLAREEADKRAKTQRAVTNARLTNISENTARMYNDYEDVRDEQIKKGSNPKDAEIFARQKVGGDWDIWRGSLGTRADEEGNPIFTQQQIAGIPQQFDPAQAKNLTGMADAGIQMVSKHEAAQRKAEAEAGKEKEKEREARSREELAAKKQAATEARARGDLAGDDETRISMAKQYLAGDKSVFTGMARSPGNMIALRKEIVQQMKEQNLTPEHMAIKLAEYKGLEAGERVLANREANIGVGVEEMRSFVPLALNALDAVPRKDFVPINRLIQMGQRNWSPQQAAFDTANQSLINAFANVIGRGGTTVHSLEEAKEMLSTADSPEMYRARASQLMKEADAAQRAPAAVRRSMEGAPADTTAPTIAPSPAPATGGKKDYSHLWSG